MRGSRSQENIWSQAAARKKFFRLSRGDSPPENFEKMVFKIG